MAFASEDGGFSMFYILNIEYRIMNIEYRSNDSVYLCKRLDKAKPSLEILRFGVLRFCGSLFFGSAVQNKQNSNVVKIHPLCQVRVYSPAYFPVRLAPSTSVR
jgi:hypothetical protein